MTAASKKYVSIVELKLHLLGREIEILAALGIDWRSDKTNIRCPYADHPDINPSWRWDDKEHRAFCTCGSQDIIGVIQKTRQLDFPAAVLFAAETLSLTS